MSVVLAGELKPWPIVSLAQIADLIRGVSYPKADAREEPAPGFVPVLRATNIQDARLVLESDLVFVAARNVSDEQILRPGDIVVATSSGSKHLVGKSGQLHEKWHGSFGAFCAAVRARPGVHPRYLALFLQAPAYWSQITKKALGVNINNLRRGDLESLELLLPPLDVQANVVAEVEKQFSRLDEAVANLKRIKANIQRCRAAVLSAAVKGNLVPTEAELARQHDRPYESGRDLLQRILHSRRSQWQGDEPYKEPAPAHADGLPRLPEGWVWATLEQLCPIFVDSAHRTPKYAVAGFPAIGPRDVVGGKLRLDAARLVSEEEFGIQTARRTPIPGDIVYSRELSLGWGAVVPQGARLCLSQGMCLFRPNESLSLSYFIYSLNGPEVRSQATTSATGSAHPHLNLRDIKALRFSLPPLAEQRRIVAELDRRLSLIKEVERTVQLSLGRANRAYESVLMRAFPQAPMGHDLIHVPSDG